MRTLPARHGRRRYARHGDGGGRDRLWVAKTARTSRGTLERDDVDDEDGITTEQKTGVARGYDGGGAARFSKAVPSTFTAENLFMIPRTAFAWEQWEASRSNASTRHLDPSSNDSLFPLVYTTARRAVYPARPVP